MDITTPLRSLANGCNVCLMLGLAFIALAPGRSMACSCPPTESVEKQYQAAAAIYVGRVVTVEYVRKPSRDNPNKLVKYERVKLRVIRRWKGPKQVGDDVLVENQIEDTGSCPAINVRNDPLWIEEIEKPGDPPHPAKLPADWLVYGFGEEPYTFPSCGNRSLPLMGDRRDEVDLLDRLTTATGSRTESRR